MINNNYLIIRNDGIGDLILTLPLIAKINQKKKENRIYLICSNRNIELAQCLIKAKLIYQFCILDLKKSKYLTYMKIAYLLRNVIFKDIFILKPSVANLLLSLMLNRKKIYSIISINKYKISGKKRYSPPLLSKLFLSNYEFIDSRDDFYYSSNTHMSEHFLNLSNFSNEIKSKFYKNIIKDHNFFNSSLLGYEKKIRNIINLKNQKKIILLHFDEKWSDSTIDVKIFLKRIESIFMNKEIVFFLTRGIKENKYETKLKKILKLKILKKNIMISKKYNNIYFFSKNSYIELVSLVKICDLVVTPHGGLSHTSTLFGKKLLDLIKFERKIFYKKWKPLNMHVKQINIDNINLIEKGIVNYLK